MAIPIIAYVAAGAGALYLLLRNRPDPVRGVEQAGTNAQGRKVAPTSGTAAFDQPVFTARAGAPPPPDAPQQEQEQFAIDALAAAQAAPAGADQVALAASEAGVSAEEFRAAARAIDTTAEILVAMGITPRDINDIVAQNRPGFGT